MGACTSMAPSTYLAPLHLAHCTFAASACSAANARWWSLGGGNWEAVVSIRVDPGGNWEEDASDAASVRSVGAGGGVLLVPPLSRRVLLAPLSCRAMPRCTEPMPRASSRLCARTYVPATTTTGVCCCSGVAPASGMPLTTTG